MKSAIFAVLLVLGVLVALTPSQSAARTVEDQHVNKTKLISRKLLSSPRRMPGHRGYFPGGYGWPSFCKLSLVCIYNNCFEIFKMIRFVYILYYVYEGYLERSYCTL